LRGFFDDILHERSKDWIFSQLDPDQAPSPEPSEPIDPDESYVSVFLRSARIVNVRAGLTRFYGMEVGLLSIAAADLAGPYLQVLQMISEKAGVANVSLAFTFADIITNGINLLTGGADKSILEIGFSVQQDSPTTGWFVAIRAPKDSLDPRTLKIDQTDNKLLAADGVSLKDYPYLVIEVQRKPNRDDWFKIPELAQAYAAIQAEFRAGDVEATQKAITAFRRIALTNNDLLERDAMRLTERLQERYAEIGPPKALHQRMRRGGREFPPLETLNLYD
jgi:hypothetical protein